MSRQHYSFYFLRVIYIASDYRYSVQLAFSTRTYPDALFRYLNISWWIILWTIPDPDCSVDFLQIYLNRYYYPQCTTSQWKNCREFAYQSIFLSVDFRCKHKIKIWINSINKWFHCENMCLIEENLETKP